MFLRLFLPSVRQVRLQVSVDVCHYLDRNLRRLREAAGRRVVDDIGRSLLTRPDAPIRVLIAAEIGIAARLF